jgi:hypothetical protein
LATREHPQVSPSTLFDRLKKTTFQVGPMHYCLALCLFGTGLERLRTACVRIGFKVDANTALGSMVPADKFMSGARRLQSGYECGLADVTSGGATGQRCRQAGETAVLFYVPTPKRLISHT